MIVGVAGYAAYRARLGLSLGERTRREVVTRTGPALEVEFQTMLIPVSTAATSLPADLVEVAAQLAAERRASLVLLAFTEIPLGEEMDMDIDDLEDVVEGLAASGRAIGEQYGIRVLTTHLRTRDPAESILAEAARRGSPADPRSCGGAPAHRAQAAVVRPRRAPRHRRGPPARHDRAARAGRDMRRHILIVCTDSRIEPQLLTGALAGALQAAPRNEIKVVRVLIPAVLPATLPITAWPQRLAARLERLREAADEIGGSLTPPARVEIVPCRSVAALLQAAWPVDALVLVGSASWGVRRAARGVAPDVAIVPARRAARRRQAIRHLTQGSAGVDGER